MTRSSRFRTGLSGGGILALGANVLNMAPWRAYWCVLTLHLAGTGRAP